MHYLFLFKKTTTFKVTYFKHSQQSSFCREELHLDKNMSFLMLCAPCSGLLQRIQIQSCDNSFKALNWKLEIKQVSRDREREKEKSFCNELLMTEMKLLFESIFIMLTQLTNGSLNQKLFQYIHAFYLQWSYQTVGTTLRYSSQATFLCQLWRLIYSEHHHEKKKKKATLRYHCLCRATQSPQNYFSSFWLLIWEGLPPQLVKVIVATEYYF